MRWLTVVSLLFILSACNTKEKGGQTGTQNAKTMTDRFMPPDWVRGTTIYEVNIRQYTPEGTFNAFAGHLPRLKELGVETLWFMPVTPIAIKKKKNRKS